MFGQGEEADKIFVFWIFEVGPSNGVDLVRSMQHDGDLKHPSIKSDHVKHVAKWTTTACHVYHRTY